MRYHLFQKFFEKVVKIKGTSFLLSKCLVSIAHHCMGYPISLIPMKASKTNKVDVFCMRTWFVGLAIKPPKSSTFSSRNLNYSLLIESHDHDQSWRLQNGTTNISWYESYYYIASKQDKIMEFLDFRVQMVLYRGSQLKMRFLGPFKTSSFKYFSDIWPKILIIQGLLTCYLRNWYYLKSCIIQDRVIQDPVIQGVPVYWL